MSQLLLELHPFSKHAQLRLTFSLILPLFAVSSAPQTFSILRVTLLAFQLSL
jgi:hypothetical protein